jgi:hypothetical protein
MKATNEVVILEEHLKAALSWHRSYGQDTQYKPEFNRARGPQFDLPTPGMKCILAANMMLIHWATHVKV